MYAKKYRINLIFGIKERFRELIARKKYLDYVLLFRDTDLIKVVTGLRRCGKSSLLALAAAEFARQGIPDENIVALDMESFNNAIATYEDLYNHVKARLTKLGRHYLFIDEVQVVKGWERAINAMRVDFNCDIYVTGSNAFLLSSELATCLSGRYVETQMLPLVFSEFI
jgi:predicted AAA+ superfamily ATPase